MGEFGKLLDEAAAEKSDVNKRYENTQQPACWQIAQSYSKYFQMVEELRN